MTMISEFSKNETIKRCAIIEMENPMEGRPPSSKLLESKIGEKKTR